MAAFPLQPPDFSRLSEAALCVGSAAGAGEQVHQGISEGENLCGRDAASTGASAQGVQPVLQSGWAV